MTENKANNNLQTSEETPMPRESMVWYRSFFDAIERLNDEQRKYQCYLMVFEYGLNRKEPDSNDDVICSLFAMVKPLIDKSILRYENCRKNGKKGAEFGKLGGAPKGNQNAKKDKQPQGQPQKQPLNVNVNVNDNYNENVNVNVNYNVNDNVYSYSDTLSHISKTFETKFPNKKMVITNITAINKINLDNIAIEQLLSKIEQSNFLLTNNNLGLEWCLIHYDGIINGDYDDYAPKQPKNAQNDANSFTAGLEATAKFLETLGD